MENIKRMQEIGDELLNFSKLVKRDFGSTTYSLSGTTLKTIYDVDEFEISVGYIKKDVEPHTHEQHEHYLCLSGELTVLINGEAGVLMQAHDHCHIAPHVLHSLKTQGCKLLVIRVPSSKIMRWGDNAGNK